MRRLEVPGHGQVKVPTTLLASSGGQVLALEVAGARLDAVDKGPLLARVRAGEVVELDVNAITFLQRPTPNRNLLRFRPALLRSLAKSFAGAPFQRNHSWDVQDRGGTVLDSQLTQVDEGGEKVDAFRMKMRLVAPWAVEGALLGTIDRFSIGWHPSGEYLCSVCEAPMSQFLWFTIPTCDHELGESYPIHDGDGNEVGKKVCELLITGAEGVEVSAVSVPAVVGTEVEKIRAALAAQRGGLAPPRTMMNKTILQVLAATLLAGEQLPENEEIAAARLSDAAAKLSDRARRAEAELETERAAHGQTKDQLTAARAELATHTDRLEAERVERLIDGARASGKILTARDDKGQPVESALEKSIRRLAADFGYDAAKERVDRLDPVAPIGTTPAARSADPTPRAGGPQLTARQKKYAQKLGLTDAQMLAELENERGANEDDDREEA